MEEAAKTGHQENIPAQGTSPASRLEVHAASGASITLEVRGTNRKAFMQLLAPRSQLIMSCRAMMC